ncbi:MAG: Fe(2+) transporter permease subunit FeoB [Magnetococcales bacterium]|nr:Fe(2+) transporter permease subunit FeoB [Magnetococcales bacterium]
MNTNRVIGIVGNPNCGKSTLFNRLTGSQQTVGNWPGVTVERKEGICRLDNDREITVVDLPGVYSLAAHSPDEQVARDFILSGQHDLIVNILDASNLERNLYLTLQLMEMRVPLMVVLNMMDVADERQIVLDPEALSRMLGCPVVAVVAKKRTGLEALRQVIAHETARETPTLPNRPELPEALSRAIDALIPGLEPAARHARMDPRWIALKLIEGDGGAPALFRESEYAALATPWRDSLEESSGDEPDILVADARYRVIDRIMAQAVGHRGVASHALTDRLDAILLHRLLGIPIFLAVLYGMFMFTINLGGTFIDFFDILFGAIFVEGTRELLQWAHAPDWLITVLADGLGGSIQTLSTFIPPIGFMFLFLSWLEDSGYMARAAFILDRLLRFIGLPGKAFIPMMVGFGCNVPAILGARTLENPRDRILTILMNPFMSCGARMPVYALFVAAFFPQGGQNVVFFLYLAGVGFAILTGLILKNTLLRGEPSPFIMELPLYHLPAPGAVLRHAANRLRGFVTRAGQVLIPVIMVLSLLNSMGTDGSFGNTNQEKSVLSQIGRQITPVFTPMGIQEENWPATVGLFIGIFAKEAVIGALDALYNQMSGQENANEEKKSFDLMAKAEEAVASIGGKFSELGKTLADPLKLRVDSFENLEEAAKAGKVTTGTLGAMTRLFDGTIGAFAYMLFVLLYFPCVAATSAIYQETGWKWTLFAAAWTTGVAWSAATLFYQIGTLARHPGSSLAWIAALALFWILVVGMMRRLSSRPAGMALPLQIQPNKEALSWPH